MWRKPDVKNNPQSSNVPEPSSTAPKAGPISPAAVTPAAIPASPANIAQSSTPSYAAPVVAAPRVTSASVIGSGLKIQGEITGDSDLVVEGEAHGRIRIANGRVTVAASGHVNADIEAVEISVDGTVQGGLKASDRVRLGPTSRVQGSVLTRRIAIEDGARLRGKVEMIRAGEVAAPASKTSVASTPAPGATVTAAPVTPVSTTNPGASPAASATKTSEVAAPAATTEADRLKATAARGSGA